MKRHFFILLFIAFACKQNVTVSPINTAKGKLFIIGGGKRPSALIDPLVEISKLKKSGYGIILPMSSSEPDSAVYYANLQFIERGLTNVVGMNFNLGDTPKSTQLDSIAKASLIYISGGDQNKFMKIIANTGIREAIATAYQNGGVIAGTSAGAAVMSKVMITGNEANYPDYDNTLRNIEAENIILDEGLGLLTTAVVDQHFIKRGRYNRLLSVCMEHPQLIGIGIDESTAILVSGDSATVFGESQVIFVANNQMTPTLKNKLMGAKNMNISVLLPGDKFALVK